MDKYEVAQILREIGLLIQLIDAEPLKGLAYRKAANTVEAIPDLKKSIDTHSLQSFPGIGEKISGLIVDMVQDNNLRYYHDLKQKIPEALFELLQIPGLGVRRVRVLFEKYQ